MRVPVPVYVGAADVAKLGPADAAHQVAPVFLDDLLGAGRAASDEGGAQLLLKQLPRLDLVVVFHQVALNRAMIRPLALPVLSHGEGNVSTKTLRWNY